MRLRVDFRLRSTNYGGQVALSKHLIVHFNAHVVATLTRIPLVDRLIRSPVIVNTDYARIKMRLP